MTQLRRMIQWVLILSCIPSVRKWCAVYRVKMTVLMKCWLSDRDRFSYYGIYSKDQALLNYRLDVTVNWWRLLGKKP